MKLDKTTHKVLNLGKQHDKIENQTGYEYENTASVNTKQYCINVKAKAISLTKLYMANAIDSVCLNDPNFAVICSFLGRYGELLGLPDLSYVDLQTILEESKFGKCHDYCLISGVF